MEQEIKQLVDNLRSEYSSGKSHSYEFRIKNLRALHSMISNEQELFYEALRKDLNKSKQEAHMTELGVCLSAIAIMINNLDFLMDPKNVPKPVIFFGESAQVQRVPLGVVLIISPWNYPIQLSILPLVGAIAGGNSVVLKVSLT